MEFTLVSLSLATCRVDVTSAVPNVSTSARSLSNRRRFVYKKIRKSRDVVDVLKVTESNPGYQEISQFQVFFRSSAPEVTV